MFFLKNTVNTNKNVEHAVMAVNHFSNDRVKPSHMLWYVNVTIVGKNHFVNTCVMKADEMKYHS